MPATTPFIRRSGAAALALVLVLAACTSGDDEGAAKDEPPADAEVVEDAPEVADEPSAAVAALLPEGIGYQDVHLLLDVEVVGADGTARSVMAEVIELATRDLGPALPFGDGAQLLPSASLQARVVDRGLEPLPSIGAGAAVVRLVDGGGILAEQLLERFPDGEVAEVLAEAEGADGLLVYSTADLSEAATDVTEGDRFLLDLTELDSVAVGDRLQVTYGFARTLPGDDPEGVDDPAELLAARWGAGAVEMLGQEGLRGREPLVVVDDAGEVTEGSSLGGWGAKGGDTFDYLPRCLQVRARSGPRSPWRAVSCVMVGGYRATQQSKDAWSGSQSPGCSMGEPGRPTPASGRHGHLDGRLVLAQDGGDGGGPGGGGGGGCGGASGDPHLRTFDGHRYSMMAVGEYVLARSDAGHVIQARFVPAGSSRRASLTRAVAFDLDGSAVMVRPERTYEPVVRVDGEVVDLVRGETYPVGEGAIVWTGPSVLALWPDGTRLYLTIWSFLNVELSPTPEAGWEGLLGSWDGDPDNDIRIRDGAVLGPDPSFEQLYRVFAPSWAVTEDDTLFHYEPGESVASFQDLDYPEAPPSLDDYSAAERAEAEATCAAAGISDVRGFQECVIDLLTTGDPDVVAAAALWSGARNLAGTAVTGVTTLAGFTTSGSVDPLVGVIDGQGRLLTRLSEVGTGSDTLLALDGRSALPVGRYDDVVGACVPGVDDEGRTWFQVDTDQGVGVAVTGRSGLPGEDGGAGGEEVVTFVPDREQRMDACRSPIAARAGGGVVLVHRGNFNHTVEAFELVDDEVRRVWRTTFEDLVVDASDVTSDGRWVTLVARDDDEVQVLLLDASDGEVRDTVALPPVGTPSRTAVLALEDRVVVANAEGRAFTGSVFAYDLADGRLAQRWQVDTDPDGLLRVPIDLVASGDLLVSWYPITEQVVALDAGDGSVRWTAIPNGFARTQQLAVTADGDVLIATTGGGIEALGPDGQVRWSAGTEDGIPPAKAFGSVDLGGRVHVLSTAGRDEPPRWYRIRPPSLDAGPTAAGTVG